MPPASLEKLDRMLADATALLAGIRAHIAEQRGSSESPPGAWLPIGTAARRFSVREDTLRAWCRRDPGLGRKRDGLHWEIDQGRLRQKLGLKSSPPASSR